MTGKVLDLDVERQLAPLAPELDQAQLGRVASQLQAGGFERGVERRLAGEHPQCLGVVAQDAQDQRVATHEGVAPERRARPHRRKVAPARVARDARLDRLAVRVERRHVAVLAASLVREGRVQPLEVGRLLDELDTEVVPLGIQCLGLQRVASAAQGRLRDVRAEGRREGHVHLHRAGERALVWPEEPPRAVELEPTGVARLAAQVRGRHPVADRAGHAVASEAAQGRVAVQQVHQAARRVVREPDLGGHRGMAAQAGGFDVGLPRGRGRHLRRDDRAPQGIARGVGHHAALPETVRRDLAPLRVPHGLRQRSVGVAACALVRGQDRRGLVPLHRVVGGGQENGEGKQGEEDESGALRRHTDSKW